MRNCQDMEERLNDYVDRLLSPSGYREVDRHLEACPGCRGALKSLGSLREAATALPRGQKPPRDLWPGVEAGLAKRRTTLGALFGWADRRGEAWPWRPGLATAAAVVLVTVTAAVTALLLRPGSIPLDTSGPEPLLPPESATLASFRAAETEYVRATEHLLRALEERRGELPPETLAVVERNLHIINDAIQQITAALENDPDPARSGHLLTLLYWRKVDLLRQALRLTSQS